MHTHGPWQIVDGHSPCFREIVGPSFEISVCILATDITFEDVIQRESDMALIAAAPDILAALKETLRILRANGDNFGKAAQLQADAAITKATK